jgi:hypothetical protein
MDGETAHWIIVALLVAIILIILLVPRIRS